MQSMNERVTWSPGGTASLRNSTKNIAAPFPYSRGDYNIIGRFPRAMASIAPTFLALQHHCVSRAMASIAPTFLALQHHCVSRAMASIAPTFLALQHHWALSQGDGKHRPYIF